MKSLWNACCSIFGGDRLLQQAFHRLFIAQFEGVKLLLFGKAANRAMRSVQQDGSAKTPGENSRTSGINMRHMIEIEFIHSGKSADHLLRSRLRGPSIAHNFLGRIDLKNI